MSESIVVIGTENVKAARLLTIRAGLKLEARGLKMSRGRSCLSIARAEGLTTKRTAAAALEEVNAYIAEHLGM